MKQEDMFAVAQEAGFNRIKTCCEGVENKFCANDEWKGDLGALAAEIERRTILRCIEFIRNGSFLHDQSPPKRFATEVTAEMEKQLLPQGMQPYRTEHGELLEITPENFGRISFEMMKADPFGIKHNCLPRRDQMFSPVTVTEEAAVISYARAVDLFKTHLTVHLLKQGKTPALIEALIKAEQETPTQELRELVERLLEEANERGAIKVGRQPLSKYSSGYDKVVKVHIADTPEVGEDGIKLNKETP